MKLELDKETRNKRKIELKKLENKYRKYLISLELYKDAFIELHIPCIQIRKDRMLAGFSCNEHFCIFDWDDKEYMVDIEEKIKEVDDFIEMQINNIGKIRFIDDNFIKQINSLNEELKTLI